MKKYLKDIKKSMGTSIARYNDSVAVISRYASKRQIASAIFVIIGLNDKKAY